MWPNKALQQAAALATIKVVTVKEPSAVDVLLGVVETWRRLYETERAKAETLQSGLDLGQRLLQISKTRRMEIN
jgi:hypothetical protein